MDSSFLKNMELIVGNKIQKNIDKCDILGCLSCKFTEKKFYLIYKKLYIPFLSDSNCESIGI
ncbi:hypothetical protein BpHYR1_044538, partial [Brachionus plicatilis]